MKIDVLTLFPNSFAPSLNESILKNAQTAGHVTIAIHDLRDAATDKHKTVDDSPYGGGTGMVLRVDVIDTALKQIIEKGTEAGLKKPHIVMMTPQGARFTAKRAEELSSYEWIILLCGHYEGFDERVRQYLVNEQISIGDFVLTGGELPAMMIIDAISRFVPGVLPEGAPHSDTFHITKDGKPALEHPHYTRPLEYNGWSVPDVLLSGNHAEIEKWRHNQSKVITDTNA